MSVSLEKKWMCDNGKIEDKIIGRDRPLPDSIQKKIIITFDCLLVYSCPTA